MRSGQPNGAIGGGNLISTVEVNASSNHARRDLKEQSAQNLQRMGEILRVATHQSPHLIKFICADSEPYEEDDPYRRVLPEPFIVHKREDALPLLNRNERKQSAIKYLPPINTTAFISLLFGVFDAVDTLHNIYTFDEQGNITCTCLVSSDIGVHNLWYNIEQNVLLLGDYETVQYEGLPPAIVSEHHIGMIAYAPPEQHTTDDIIFRTRDIFALGWTIHDLLLCRDPAALISTQEKRRIITPAEYWELFAKQFSPEIASVLKKATDEEPEYRYQTVSEFWTAFVLAWNASYGITEGMYTSPDFHSSRTRALLETRKKRFISRP